MCSDCPWTLWIKHCTATTPNRSQCPHRWAIGVAWVPELSMADALLGSPGVGVPGFDPTPEELAAINTLVDAVNAVKCTEEVYKILATELGEPQAFREVAMIPKPVWDGVVAGLMLGGRPLLPVATARLELLRRIARLKLGLTPGDPSAATPPPPASAGGGGIGAPPTAEDNPRKLKLSSIIDRTLDSELKPLKTVDVRAMFREYRRIRGGEPGEDIEPTSDQLGALKQVLDSDAPPYADFSVWGPHGRRLLEKLVYVAFIFNPDGTWVRQELPGPPDAESWWASWRVFRTAMLLLGAADTEPLDNYGEFVRRLSRKYPEAWFIIYTGDVRMRSERFERLRRVAEIADVERATAGLATRIDTKRPWNTIFADAILDKDFWDENVREPALLYLSRCRTREDTVQDGTAQASLPAAGEAARRRVITPEPAARKRENAQGGKGSRKLLRGEDYSEKRNGLYVKNKAGKPLCPDFVAGRCTKPGQPCSKGEHQCPICLAMHYPSWHNQGGESKASGSEGSKGKGKGRKGGKRW